VFLTIVLGAFALVSLLLMMWQFIAGLRYPLHRAAAHAGFAPPVSVLKPLKGCDPNTRDCLASWLEQSYPGPVQILFGVADPNDPVCVVVQELLQANPKVDAQLVVCLERVGPNAKISKLLQLDRQARYEHLVMSDADVFVPKDFLSGFLPALRDPGVGLVHCFYRLAKPMTAAMQWEAVGINADFWAQVLQARDLGMKDFALGAVLGTTRSHLERAGSWAALLDCLADDYELGRRMARTGARVELGPVVVECRERALGWAEVWQHQLRWARTIRYCRPWSYFFSLLGNATVWPLLFCLFGDAGGFSVSLVPPSYAVPGYYPPGLHVSWGGLGLVGCLFFRIISALWLQSKCTRCLDHLAWWWMVPVKDLLQAAVWAVSFCGNQVVWRGERFRLWPGGKLEGQSDQPVDLGSGSNRQADRSDGKQEGRGANPL
jgi:ceramide glucosyltransferase